MATAPSIVIDTDIFSFLFRGGERAKPCVEALEGKIPALSFQTIGELWSGAIKAGWGEEKRGRLDEAIKAFVLLACDELTVRSWAELDAATQIAGQPKETADLWIAASARRHGLPVLTSDKKFPRDPSVEVVLIGTA